MEERLDSCVQLLVVIVIVAVIVAVIVIASVAPVFLAAIPYKLTWATYKEHCCSVPLW